MKVGRVVGRKGVSGMAGARLGPRQPTKEATTTSLWTLITFPSTRRMAPRRRCSEHRRPRRCHPPPESNIDPCRQSQAPNLALPSCIPHCRHGGSRLSGAFLPPPSSYLSFPLSQINVTQHTGGAVKIVDSTTFTVSTTIAMAEVTVNPGAMRYEMVIVSSNFRRLRES